MSEVKQYRKKPVVIEAMLWDGTTKCAFEMLNKWKAGFTHNVEKSEAYIITLEGTMTANKGDYIIKGVKGEFYPCKPDIFKATYELVEARSKETKP